MTPAEIRTGFLEELISVAPDIDPATVCDDDHLQNHLELDSIDFLNLVSALHKRFGVSVPEADYLLIATPAKAVQYLQSSLARVMATGAHGTRTGAGAFSSRHGASDTKPEGSFRLTVDVLPPGLELAKSVP